MSYRITFLYTILQETEVKVSLFLVSFRKLFLVLMGRLSVWLNPTKQSLGISLRLGGGPFACLRHPVHSHEDGCQL